jgi:hypothetical protein
MLCVLLGIEVAPVRACIHVAHVYTAHVSGLLVSPTFLLPISSSSWARLTWALRKELSRRTARSRSCDMASIASEGWVHHRCVVAVRVVQARAP